MTFKRITTTLLCAVIACFALSTAADAQQGMTYDEYKIKMAEYDKRTSEARLALAECKKMGETVGTEITALEKDVAAVNEEIYEVLGTDQSSIDGFLAELDRIEARLMGLLNLSDEALFDKRDEVNSMEDRSEKMKKDILANLPDAQTKFRNIDQLLERINARMPRKRVKPYTVARGDNLWNIAKKPSIYNDAYLWPRIYMENRGKIKNPDLIYPSWVLNMPFGVDLNQHLVTSGQHLSTIADAVYKDPTKWHRIFRANQSQILDANLIFPAQVLDIPAN
tara:strand:+ start:4894 stop:5733 length:840 start_codon:yes stop_codon:yes gene_type:complete